MRTTISTLKGKTIAFAASGGLDSCTITRWLVDNGVHVVCFTADMAQPDEADFDSVRQQHVLLYPEGAVLLNETGAAILELCDGRRSVAAIAKILEERYHCDVLADVTEYLSGLFDRELIRDA